MQLPTGVANEFFQGFKIVIYYLSSFEPVNDFRANVRTAANSRSVAESFSGLLDGCQNLSLSSCGLFDQFGTGTGQGTRANKRSRPRTEVFRAEILPHDLFDVLIDVMSLYIY